MDLREYLFFNRLTQKEFSEKIECNRTYLSGIIHKRIKPSKRLAKDIELATNGQVKAEDLLKDAKESDDQKP